MRSTPKQSHTMIERLEARRLLSATAIVAAAAARPAAHAASPQASATLVGTYSGALRLNRGVNIGVSARQRTISITFTGETADGQLTGAATVTDLGTFLMSGFVRGSTFTLVLDGGGRSAGSIVGRVTHGGMSLDGQFAADIGGQSAAGGFRTAPGGAAVSAAGISPTVGSASAAPTFTQPDLLGSLPGTLSVHRRGAATLSNGSHAAVFTVSTESDEGLIAGTINIDSGASVWSFQGVIDGHRLTLVLDGAGGTGAVIGTASTSARRTVQGTLDEVLAGNEVSGRFVFRQPKAAGGAAAGGYAVSTIPSANGTIPGIPGSGPGTATVGTPPGAGLSGGLPITTVPGGPSSGGGGGFLGVGGPTPILGVNI